VTSSAVADQDLGSPTYTNFLVLLTLVIDKSGVIVTSTPAEKGTEKKYEEAVTKASGSARDPARQSDHGNTRSSGARRPRPRPRLLAPASGWRRRSRVQAQKGQRPRFHVERLDGKTWKLSDQGQEGRCRLSTWCNICKEMPVLEKVYQEYKGGREFFGVALDENVAAIKKVVREKGVTYPILVDKDTKVATEIYQLSGPIPYKVVIDISGTIVYDHVGDYVDYPEIVDVFDQLLERSRRRSDRAAHRLAGSRLGLAALRSCRLRPAGYRATPVRRAAGVPPGALEAVEHDAARADAARCP
jgi:peroxiredoxin